MTLEQPELERLEARLKRMRESGLSDFRCYSSESGGSPEAIAREANGFLDALESGRFEVFSFNDRPDLNHGNPEEPPTR